MCAIDLQEAALRTLSDSPSSSPSATVSRDRDGFEREPDLSRTVRRIREWHSSQTDDTASSRAPARILLRLRKCDNPLSSGCRCRPARATGNHKGSRHLFGSSVTFVRQDRYSLQPHEPGHDAKAALGEGRAAVARPFASDLGSHHRRWSWRVFQITSTHLRSPVAARSRLHTPQ